MEQQPQQIDTRALESFRDWALQVFGGRAESCSKSRLLGMQLPNGVTTSNLEKAGCFNVHNMLDLDRVNAAINGTAQSADGGIGARI